MNASSRFLICFLMSSAIPETVAAADLSKSVNKGDRAAVESYLKGGGNPNKADASGTTPLMLAVRDGKLDLVRILLSYNADVNAMSKRGYTPVIYCAGFGGIAVSVGARGAVEQRQLESQGTVEILKALLDKGGDVNAQAADGSSGLSHAARYDRDEIAKQLLERGAHADVRDNHKTTPLHAAAFYRSSKIANVLIAGGADVNARTDELMTPLMLAAGAGSESVVRALLEKQAEVNAADEREETALIKAAFGGHVSIVALLIEKSADVNAKTNEGYTALSNAAYNDHPEVIRLLIAAKAEINAKNKAGRSALSYAVGKKEQEGGSGAEGGQRAGVACCERWLSWCATLPLEPAFRHTFDDSEEPGGPAGESIVDPGRSYGAGFLPERPFGWFERLHGDRKAVNRMFLGIQRRIARANAAENQL